MKQVILPKISGIYAVRILDSDTWYIGESQDIYARWMWIQHRNIKLKDKELEFFILEEMTGSPQKQRLDKELQWHKELKGKYKLISTPTKY